jgi:hypothetical protein
MCWLSGEPTLDEMLFDPTVVATMNRDGVAPADLREFLREISRRVKCRRGVPCCPTNAPTTHSP